MADHPSAEKRNRQRIKRTVRNRAVKSAVRTQVKVVRAALAAKDPKAAKEALDIATKALDKAAGKGALAKKAASRTVSRLSSQVHALQKAPPVAPVATRTSKAPKAAAAAKEGGEAAEARPKRAKSAKKSS